MKVFLLSRDGMLYTARLDHCGTCRELLAWVHGLLDDGWLSNAIFHIGG